MKLRRKPAFTCQGCGAGVSRKDLRRGLALLREGRIYCRGCFEKMFPGECPNHPGKLAESVCAMCHMPLCEDCVIEISGKVVCGTCKPLALARIERGEEIGPLDLSIPAEVRALEPRKPPKYKVYPPIEEPSFYFSPSVVTAAALASVVFCAVPFVVLVDLSNFCRAGVFALCGLPAAAALYIRLKSTLYYDYEDVFAAGWLHVMTVAIILSLAFNYICVFMFLTGLVSAFREP